MSDNAFIHKELFWLTVGRQLGQGMTRNVWTVRNRDDLVIKTEEGGRSFDNIREWEIWNAVVGTPFERCFAPIVNISSCGSVMVMRRTVPPQVKDLPEWVPVFINDCHYHNFGMLDGRLVCHDYANSPMLKTGLHWRFTRAAWHGERPGER